MNFGKNGIRKEKEALRSSTPKVEKKAGISILRVLLFIFIAVAAMGICMAAGAYRGIIADSPEISDVNIMPLGNASFVYDSSGQQVQKLSSVGGNRISVSISDIPQNMQHAIVAIEDSRFYEHNGVDPHGMLRAILVALQSGFSRSEGASTITQQLLKNNVFTDWLTESRMDRIKRKLQEQYLAVELEKSLTESGQDAKSVILENYLNTVNFGNGAYGVQTAAQTYFGKDCKDLTLSECAVLAAIPQNPSRYNPLLYPEDNAKRMKTVLDYMLDQGYITQKDHDDALADNVYDRIKQQAGTTDDSQEVYSYFVDALIDQVRTDLMEQKGYTEVQANNAIYSGGLQIYSTEDANVQSVMDEEFENEANYPADTQYELDWAMTVNKADGTQVNYSCEMLEQYFQQQDPSFDLLFSSEDEGQSYIDQYKTAVLGAGDEIFMEWSTYAPQPQACMTVIDQSTGQVKGIVGGRGTKTASLTLNRATDSYRQPGSTFKIPSTYGPALDKDSITLASTFTDKEMTYDNGTAVENADNEHHGTMTVRQAIIDSNNIIAVQVLTQITPAVGFDYLLRLGFTSLVNDDVSGDVTQALALGGITNGVSNLQLTSAYAAIANGGTYTAPTFYTKVTDQKGNVLLENKPVSKKVFKESTAYLLTSAMEDVVTEGTGTGYQLTSDLPVAGKTGTTNDYKDLVFVGYTPYYTAGIWAGYDTNLELPAEDRTYLQTLWTNVMNRISTGQSYKEFTMPDSVEQLTICSESGLLAGKGCPTTTEYFAKSDAPTQTCTQHTPVVKTTPTPTKAASSTTTTTTVTTTTDGSDTTDDTTDTDDTDDTDTTDTTDDTDTTDTTD